MIRKTSQSALWGLPLLFIAVLTSVWLSTGEAKRDCPGETTAAETWTAAVLMVLAHTSRTSITAIPGL